jgi:antitoxin VapB
MVEWHMSASLNIKDPDAHRLANALARETGEPMTRIVVEALRARLHHLEQRKARASLAELLAIAGRSAILATPSSQDEGIYGTNGLPR